MYGAYRESGPTICRPTSGNWSPERAAPTSSTSVSSIPCRELARASLAHSCGLRQNLGRTTKRGAKDKIVSRYQRVRLKTRESNLANFTTVELQGIVRQFRGGRGLASTFFREVVSGGLLAFAVFCKAIF